MLSRLYDISIATGDEARTIIPDTPVPRKRSRARTTSETPDVYKKQKNSGNSLLAEAINRSTEAHKSSVIKAIELLDLDYSTRLSDTCFDQAVDILSDEMRASVFISLSGDRRDRWLERHAHVVFNNSTSQE
jgi:hypothetical protein